MDGRNYAITLFAVVLLGLLLAGCAQEKLTCNKPYIVVGNNCCLDTNDNGICDADEKISAPETPLTPDSNLNAEVKTEVCEDTCIGTTFYSKGEFKDKKCTYAQQDENSVKCGYVPPVIQIVEMGCTYQYNSTFLIYLKSVSETSIPVGSHIKLLLDDGHSTSELVQRNYSKGQRIWEDTYIHSGWDTLGSAFKIEGINPHAYSRKDQNYAFIYCAPDIKSNGCNKDTGLVLYEGNALEDCGLEKVGYGYFTPYNNFIEIAPEQSNRSNKDTALLESFNLNPSDFPDSYKIVGKLTGFQTNAKYYSDFNKQAEKELNGDGFVANHTITIARKELDPKQNLMLPAEQVFSSISKFDTQAEFMLYFCGHGGKVCVTNSIAKDYNADAEYLSDREATIKAYSDLGYKNVVYDQVGSNAAKGEKMTVFSVSDSSQALGSGKYTVISIAIRKEEYVLYFILEGYSDEITPAKADQYVAKILERIGNK